jgi:hypothetical protein
LVLHRPTGPLRLAQLVSAERWRCTVTGCNPVIDEAGATKHRDTTGHRVAKWPKRSAEGERKAQLRNQTGYYDKYNRGEKSPENRRSVRFVESDDQ